MTILAFPETLPITAESMNYSTTLLAFVILSSLVWFALDAKKRYIGPRMCVLFYVSFSCSCAS